MKVFCLIPAIVGGGAEKVMSILVNRLVRHSDFTVTLVSMEFIRDEHTISPDVRRIYLSQTKESDSSLKKGLTFPIQFFKFINIIRKERPDLILAFLDRAIILTLLSTFFHKTPVIVSERNGVTQSLNTRHFFARHALRFTYKFLFKRASKIIAVSRKIKEELTQFQISPKKIEVVHNPYEIEVVEELKQKDLPKEYADFFKSGKVIINIGRFHSVKNQLHLIDVFMDVKKSIPELKLCIIGKGPLRHQIESSIVEKDIQQDVLLPGFQKNPYAFLYNSTLYVATSLYEGFPNTLVEAMLCEIPVVAYDCIAGPREILEDKYGLLIPLNHSEMLRNAIESLLTNPDSYKDYKLAGYSRAKEFSTEVFIDKITTIFRNIRTF